MTVKLWVDDDAFTDANRKPPTPDWNVATSSDEAIRILERMKEATERVRPEPVFEELSLDHDLGGGDTARPIVWWMYGQNFWPERIVVHSANAYGRDWLLGTLRNIAPPSVVITTPWGLG